MYVSTHVYIYVYMYEYVYLYLHIYIYTCMPSARLWTRLESRSRNTLQIAVCPKAAAICSGVRPRSSSSSARMWGLLRFPPPLRFPPAPPSLCAACTVPFSTPGDTPSK